MEGVSAKDICSPKYLFDANDNCFIVASKLNGSMSRMFQAPPFVIFEYGKYSLSTKDHHPRFLLIVPHLHSGNENKPVNRSRDTQELMEEAGRPMLQVFAHYKHVSGLLDTF